MNDPKNDTTQHQPGTDSIQLLKQVGAILTDDHFVLTTGRHSDTYINKDALYPHPEATAKMGELFAQKHGDLAIDTVAAPALGGIILSTWTAYHLSKLKGTEVAGVYAEKMPDKSMKFTRGYDAYIRGKRVLVIEDLTTTGGSVQKVVELVRQTGGQVVAVCVMVNRDPETVNEQSIGAPFSALGELSVQSWEEDELPDEIAARPVNVQVGHGASYMAQKKEVDAEK